MMKKLKLRKILKKRLEELKMKHLRKLLLLSKTLNKKKLKILGLNTLTLLLNKPRDNKNFKKRWLMIPWNQNINLMLLNVPIKICIIFPINSML